MFQHATPLGKSAPWTPNISAKQNHMHPNFKYLTLLTLKRASRHNGVHFFNISTSKSAPNLSVFYTFDFEMCFAPQRRALFQHHNFQKWSEPEVIFSHFDSEMCFVPQRRALFRHLNFQKCSERMRCFVLYILTSKCASRHNGVQFFISHPARWLRTRRFSEPTFQPSWATNHWKNTVIRDFSTFSHTCIFFLLTLSLLWSSLLLSLLFSSLTLPTSVFSSVHIVGSLTSKLSSTMLY